MQPYIRLTIPKIKITTYTPTTWSTTPSAAASPTGAHTSQTTWTDWRLSTTRRPSPR